MRRCTFRGGNATVAVDLLALEREGNDPAFLNPVESRYSSPIVSPARANPVWAGQLIPPEFLIV
jgi:hypothetical protein